MSIVTAASGKSAWRGYDYYLQKKVLECNEAEKDIYMGKVEGSGDNIYDVTIDIKHPKKSVCNCPHAEGSRVVCKHKVALFFTIFPEEAENYIREIEEYEEELEQQRDDRYDEILEYVYSLSEAELRNELISRMMYEEFGDDVDFDW